MEQNELTLPVINVHAAGIDVGSYSHMVTIDRIKSNVIELS